MPQEIIKKLLCLEKAHSFVLESSLKMDVLKWRQLVIKSQKQLIKSMHFVLIRIGFLSQEESFPLVRDEIVDVFYRMIRDNSFIGATSYGAVYYSFEIAVQKKIADEDKDYLKGASIIYPQYFNSSNLSLVTVE